jgi:hypothetical protein
MLFDQHSAESAIRCLGVGYVCSRGGFIIGLGGPCCRFHGSSYLLRIQISATLFSDFVYLISHDISRILIVVRKL